MADLTGDVALEAADDLRLGKLLRGGTLGIGAGARAVPKADDRDHVEGPIRLTITAPAEPVTHRLAGGYGYRVRATQMSEGGIRAEPLDILTGRHQQLCRVPDPDTEQRDRPACRPLDKTDEVRVELIDLTVECDDSNGDRTTGELLATDARIYSVDPRTLWQRGSNENTNGLLRQYFPKGTDLSVHSQEHLDGITLKLNTRPRKTPGFATAGLVTNALGMAIEGRRPDGTVIHSDQGTQFTSWAFTRRALDSGLVPSIGSVGSCFDCETGAASRPD